MRKLLCITAVAGYYCGKRYRDEKSLAHVDLFEHSSGPPERNIKWPKTGGS